MKEQLHNETPLFFAHELSKKLDKKVYFKMDCYQPTGSFKIRGVGRRCQEAAANGAKHFVIASGGNAGLATAYAGWRMGIKTTVVLPTTTDTKMKQRIEALDAEVKVFGDVWDEANIYAQSLVKKEKAVYIHPFNHPTIWAGNASVIKECSEQMPEPDVLIVAVGGGGYFCGVMEGLEKYKWLNTTVLAAETTGAASLAKAIDAKALVSLEQMNSIASSLGAKQVAQRALEWGLTARVKNYTVTDSDTLLACQDFLAEIGHLVEPACGAALAAVYQNLDIIKEAKSVLVLVCGGRSMTKEKFDIYCNEILE